MQLSPPTHCKEVWGFYYPCYMVSAVESISSNVHIYSFDVHSKHQTSCVFSQCQRFYTWRAISTLISHMHESFQICFGSNSQIARISQCKACHSARSLLDAISLRIPSTSMLKLPLLYILHLGESPL